MNAMDEITYWIYTKRAPCLMNYDDDLLKKRQETESRESKLQTPLSISDDDPKTISPKKRKRKLSMLDDDSLSPKVPENVFFNSSNRHHSQEKVLSSCKSSVVDFNIQKCSIQDKSKRKNLQKNGRTTLHKKNIIVSSTPKVTVNLRRSLRNSRKSFNDSNQLNSSFEILNGMNPKKNSGPTIIKQKVEKCKQHNKLACGDETLRSDAALETEKVNIKRNFNGKFEDLSDVSGFTANYIRSTKLHSSKNGKRSKSNRNLLKESRQSLQKEQNKTIICLNKSVNTGVGNQALDQSTDSSQNCLNLVTTVSCQQRPVRVSRSTSLLKFIESKPNICNNNMDTSRETHLDLSIHSPNNESSRYPKRYKNNISQHKYEKCTPNLKLKMNKNAEVLNISSHIDKCDRKENPSRSLLRTRSGRSLGITNLTIQRSDTSILVISNETEPVSSAVTVNVASPSSTPNNLLRNVKITALSSKSMRRKSSMNGRKSGQSTLGRDSLREKSGFAACFSDSDEDKPLKSQKFFC